MKRLEKFLTLFVVLGIVLLSTALLLPEIDFSILFTLFAVVGFLVIPTYAIKQFTKFDTFYIVSLLKTKRVIGFIDLISKPGLWDVLADLGLVLGFGAIAVDYLVGRKKRIGQRVSIACASTAILFLLSFAPLWYFFVVGNQAILPLLLLFSISFALGGFMLFTLVSLAWNAVDIFVKLLAGKMPCPGVAPIIPGIQIPNVPTFLTPPIYVWGAFLIIVADQEFSHGAIMKRAKVKIKTVGIALAGLLPIGAFVEPDEKQIVKKPDRTQLRIYAIGPASNLYSIPVFVAIVAVLSIAFSPTLNPLIDSMEKQIEIDSVVIAEVLNDYDICGNTFEVPAQGVIEEGWVLRKHNGIELKTFYDFRQAFGKPDRNVSMVFEKQDGEIIELSLEKNTRNEIGIKTQINYVEGREPGQDYIDLMALLLGLGTFFSWLLLLSFALATVNFLPMEPFDGGKIAKIVFLPYFGFMKMSKAETKKLIGRLMLWIVLGLLLLNALPLFL